jgi:hypothetical protein
MDLDFNFYSPNDVSSIRNNYHVIRYTCPKSDFASNGLMPDLPEINRKDIAAKIYGYIQAPGLFLPSGSLAFYNQTTGAVNKMGTFVMHDFKYKDLSNNPIATPSKTLFARENLVLTGTHQEKQSQLYRLVLGEKVPKLGNVPWIEVRSNNIPIAINDQAPSISSLTKSGLNSLELNYLLSVNGLAVFESALIMNSHAFETWGDYVFEPTYKLPKLDTVEAYVKREKHLPGIPSAKEIQEGGLDLATIARENTKKIEELFLYVIELKKENDLLKEKVATLEAK